LVFAGQQGPAGSQRPQPVNAAAEGGAPTKQQPASAQDAGTNGSAGAAPGAGNGQGAGQGGDANGAPTSAGLPIAPLRLDSGLQVCCWCRTWHEGNLLQCMCKPVSLMSMWFSFGARRQGGALRDFSDIVQAQEPGEGSAEMSMGLWSGKLKHRMATAGGYSTVDLLNLTALIPDRYLTSANHSGALLETPTETSSLVPLHAELGEVDWTRRCRCIGQVC
jgi:hypothetical protein